MNLVHVVPHVDDEASGPSYSVPHLCQHLAACGHSVELLCLRARSEVAGIRITVFPQWRSLGQFAMSPALGRALKERANHADIVHNHSLWAMPNVAAGWVVPGRHARLVTSPRGTLSKWALARSKWRKRALWPIQKRVLVAANLLHATSEHEYASIRAAGLKNPVAVIPNGVDLPEIPEDRKKAPDRMTLLFLGRLHPVKGLDHLLGAWNQLESRHPAWRLVIAGRGEPEHEKSIRDLAAGLALKRVEFAGPVYGSEKSATLAGADLFVLPSHTENFGQVVAETLAHGVPAVVGKGAPWQELESEGCGWWVDNSTDTLAKALDQAMALGRPELEAKGRRGRDWMGRDHVWDVIGRRMSDAYRWLLDGGEKPGFVRLT